MTGLVEVLARLGAAEVGSEDLDQAIADAVLVKDKAVVLAGDPFEMPIQLWRYPDGSTGTELRFSRSLDAALTLVPAGWSWQVEKYPRVRAALAEPIMTDFGPGLGIREQHSGATPPLALCIAALRALEAGKERG